METKTRRGTRPAFTRHFTVTELERGPHPLESVNPQLQGHEFITLGLHFDRINIGTAKGREGLVNEFARYITHLDREIVEELVRKVVKLKWNASRRPNGGQPINAHFVRERFGLDRNLARRINTRANKLFEPMRK